MADEGKPNGEAAEGAAAPQPVQFRVLAQYIKDLSFENPGAPESLNGNLPFPKVEISVDVQARPRGDQLFECDLALSASAKRDGTTVFVVELVFGGVFQIANVPQEALEPLVLIECPRMLFPYARRVFSDVTRDGGFPPLLLEPIDFGALYRARLQARAREKGESGAAAG